MLRLQEVVGLFAEREAHDRESGTVGAGKFPENIPPTHCTDESTEAPGDSGPKGILIPVSFPVKFREPVTEAHRGLF